MKLARLIGDVMAETFDASPEDLEGHFHPDFIAALVEVPPEAMAGWLRSVGGVWGPAPAPEAIPLTDADARSFLNSRLNASAWTQLPDAPLTVEQRAPWTAYRQALRDLSGSADFLFPDRWPQAPA